MAAMTTGSSQTTPGDGLRDQELPHFESLTLPHRQSETNRLRLCSSTSLDDLPPLD
jgi:hypothetical protein